MSRWLHPVVIVLSAIPVVYLIYSVISGQSIDPIEDSLHTTGEWALIFLLLSLSVTPVVRSLKKPQFIRLRRTLGLICFTYACLHLTTYIGLDQFFAWSFIIEDIFERPFITIGMLAFLSLVPLAITSTKNMVKRLGKRWRQLHKLVYVAGVLAVIHFFWYTKADSIEPVIYAGFLIALLGWRIIRSAQKRT